MLLSLAIRLVKERVPKKQNLPRNLMRGEEMAEALGAARGGTNGLEKEFVSQRRGLQRRLGAETAMHRDQATPAELWAPLASF